MIKPNFTPAQVSKMFREKVHAIESTILENLKFIAEKFVANARSQSTYKDQSGNLRSSIGYIITKDGKRIYSAFPGSASTGKAKGVEVAEQEARKYPKGYALVVVAGMSYAGAVEKKGYNVISAQSFKAVEDIRNMVARLKNKF